MRIFQAPASDTPIIDLAPDVMAVILHVLSAGWEMAKLAPDVHIDAGEVVMTERLRDGMRAVLKQSRHKHLIVLAGTESRSTPDVVVPDGRTDISVLSIEVFLRTQEHDPHIIIECKRLAQGNRHLFREYVREGMDRFIRGQYATLHTAGIMVGYLLAGSSIHAVNGINVYLQGRQRDYDCLQCVPSHPYPVWGSQHRRQSSNSDIILWHIFLPL